MSGRKEKREAVKSVDVDNRLSQIFVSHKQSEQASNIPEPMRSSGPGSSAGDSSWLAQFISQKPNHLDMTPIDESSDVSSVFVVSKNEIRPFWCLSDDKQVISLWKKSRSALTKDCQKQRKLSTRKAIRR